MVAQREREAQIITLAGQQSVCTVLHHGQEDQTSGVHHQKNERIREDKAGARIMPGSRQVDVFLSKDPVTGRAPAKDPSPAAASDEGNDLYTAPNNAFFLCGTNCLIKRAEPVGTQIWPVGTHFTR